MNLIRDYHEGNDAQAADRMIAATYRKLNLGFASPTEQGQLLAPYCQNRCEALTRQAALAHVLRGKYPDGFTFGSES